MLVQPQKTAKTSFILSPCDPAFEAQLGNQYQRRPSSIGIQRQRWPSFSLIPSLKALLESSWSYDSLTGWHYVSPSLESLSTLLQPCQNPSPQSLTLLPLLPDSDDAVSTLSAPRHFPLNLYRTHTDSALSNPCLILLT